MSNKKNCAFQYATAPRYGSGKIKEDTGLITQNEAKELWKKYVPIFIEDLENGENPEMAIWVDMTSESGYSKTLVYADRETKTDGKRLWNIKKEYLEV